MLCGTGVGAFDAHGVPQPYTKEKFIEIYSHQCDSTQKLTVAQEEELARREAEELCQRNLAESRGTFTWSGWGDEESASNEGGWGSASGWGTSDTDRWGAAIGGETSEWGTFGKGLGASREDQRGEEEEIEAEPPVVPLGRPPRRAAPALPPPDIQPGSDPWDTIDWGNEPSTRRRTVYRPAPELREQTFFPGTIPGTNIPLSNILDMEFLALMLTTANGDDEAEETAAEPAQAPDKDPAEAHERYMRTSGFRVDDTIWHQRLGHPSRVTLKSCIEAGVFAPGALLHPDGTKVRGGTHPRNCTVCPEATLSHQPFPLLEPGTVPVEVALDSRAARGVASGGAASGGAEPASAEPGGAEPEGAEPGGAEFEGAGSGGAEPRGTASAGGPAGASPRVSPQREPLSPQQLRKWFAQQTCLLSGVAGAGGSATGGTGAGGARAVSLGGAGVTARAGGTGGAGAAGPGGARTRGTGAAGAGGVGDPGAGDPGVGGTGTGGAGAGVGDPGARGAGAGGTDAGGAVAAGTGAGDSGAGDIGAGGAGAGGAGAGDPGAGDTRAGGAGAGGTGAVDPGAGDAGAGGAGAGGTGAGGTVQRRPFFIPPPPSSTPLPDSVLCQVLSLPSSTGLPPSLLSPPPHQSQPQLQPDSPLLAPSPYTEQTNSFTERREPESRPASPVCAVCTGHRVLCPRPPPVPGTKIMALRPSSVPLRVPLPPPPASSLLAIPQPESDLARTASPVVPRLLATNVTDPSFESTAASALFSQLVDFAAACRLNYAARLVAESESDCPPSVEGECALGTDVLEDW
ncbi:unnamed protein product [Closterium sp. NIES-53]